jgi:hypothetical protein
MARFERKEWTMQKTAGEQQWSSRFDEIDRDRQLKQVLDTLENENGLLKTLEHAQSSGPLVLNLRISLTEIIRPGEKLFTILNTSRKSMLALSTTSPVFIDQPCCALCVIQL